MHKLWVIGLALVATSCGEAPAEKKVNTATIEELTPEQAFYAKYPWRTMEGIQSRVGPAPFGDAQTVAEAAIKYNEHPCPKVTGAVRNDVDGSVTAKCSNGERYNVFKVEAIAEPMALKCSALKKLMDMDLATCR